MPSLAGLAGLPASVANISQPGVMPPGAKPLTPGMDMGMAGPGPGFGNLAGVVSQAFPGGQPAGGGGVVNPGGGNFMTSAASAIPQVAAQFAPGGNMQKPQQQVPAPSGGLMSYDEAKERFGPREAKAMQDRGEAGG